MLELMLKKGMHKPSKIFIFKIINTLVWKLFKRKDVILCYWRGKFMCQLQMGLEWKQTWIDAPYSF
jgi:hypothetical protein